MKYSREARKIGDLPPGTDFKTMYGEYGKILGLGKKGVKVQMGERSREMNSKTLVYIGMDYDQIIKDMWSVI